jgi:hypothetical protein
MTDTGITRVEAITLHEKQPLIQDSGLVVEWRPDQPINDNEYDQDFHDRPAPDIPFDAGNYSPIDFGELTALDEEYAPPAPPAPLVQGARIHDIVDDMTDNNDNQYDTEVDANYYVLVADNLEPENETEYQLESKPENENNETEPEHDNNETEYELNDDNESENDDEAEEHGDETQLLPEGARPKPRPRSFPSDHRGAP